MPINFCSNSNCSPFKSQSLKIIAVSGDLVDLKMAYQEEVLDVDDAVHGNPAYDEKNSFPKGPDAGLAPEIVTRITRISSVLSALVAGIALFSDGYNAQIIGYMEPLFSDLYCSHQLCVNEQMLRAY
jgi:hypothetical protein